MGFRLFRRIRLAPGVSLNLSKSGLSTSFGRRGYHVTVGHGHLRSTVGLPGTGMYWTSVSGAGRRQTRPVARRAIRRAPPPASRRSSSPGDYRTAALGCLALVGILAVLAATAATSGLALIPIVVVAVVAVVVVRRYRQSQPAFIAGRLVRQAASAADPGVAVGLLHSAVDTDPSGKDTLLACAGWFYDHGCWADAADAYAGILHIESSPTLEIRHSESLIGAGLFEEAVAELQHLRGRALDDSDAALVLSLLARVFALKGDPQQGLAFVKEAGLQKRSLTVGARQCLLMRAVCRYLLGQKAAALEDIDRLYAIDASGAVLDVKTAMAAHSFRLEPARPYPDWYPSRVQISEGPVVEEVPDGHAEELRAGAISPDGAWRWSGTQWDAIAPAEDHASTLLPAASPTTTQPPADPAAPG